jgi:hypothetical protein
MLIHLGSISEICDDWGMPLIAMMYPRGKKIDSEHDAEVVKLAAVPVLNWEQTSLKPTTLETLTPSRKLLMDAQCPW